MRLFVAISPSQEIRDRLIRAMDELKPLSRAPRWVRPGGLHLTLKFLGEVQPAQLHAIFAALREIRTPEPIAIHFRGVGSFPSHAEPRVLWAALDESHKLKALASSIESKMLLLGFPAESRDFSPHITLARISSRERIDNLARAAAALASYDFGAMLAHEFHLFQSTLKPSGAEYSSLETFRFAQDAQ